MKKRDKRQEEGGNAWLNATCEILKGGVLAGIITIVSLLVCAILVSMGVLPVSAMEGAVLAVCVLGTLIGGVYAVGRSGGRRLLAGLGVGAVLFLLLLTAGLIAYEGASIANGGLGILCACLCGGAIPGILGRKPKKKRRR